MTDLQRRLLADDNVTKTGTLGDTDLIPVERAGVTVGMYGSALKIGATYKTVAESVAATGLTIGDYIRVLGYERPGDWFPAPTAVYEVVADGTGTVDGGSIIQCTGTAVRLQLQHGSIVYAGWFNVTYDSAGLARERSAQWNAAFAYAASQADTYPGDDGLGVPSIEPGGFDFVCVCDFLCKDVLDMFKPGGGAARRMHIHWSGTVIATPGGEFDAHTHARPLPMVHAKLRNSVVSWPEFQCEMLCAGVKAKTDIANQHANLKIFGLHRYGLWVVNNNDSIWRDCIIKQFVRNPLWIRNGVDPDDWSEWNGDCVVATTKDRIFENFQVGWGGPCVRITDGYPTNDDERIPGQNCYWCGLSASQDYLDGDNGGGDDVFNAFHMMQGVDDDGWTSPRTGYYADYDFATGDMVFREVDSPIGILSYVKTSNLSFFDRIDNDAVIHLLFGAQIEMTGELPGSAVNPQTLNSAETALADNYILDPRIRVFASRGAAGAERFPFMSSMMHQRMMSVSFERDIVTHQTAITCGGLDENHAFVAAHQSAIETAITSTANMRYIDTTGLTDIGDNVHFDGAALVTLGEAHGDQIARQLLRNPSDAPVVILGLGQSNLVGNTTSTGGSHTIEPGVYVWNGSVNDGAGNAFITAEFGVAPFDRGVNPWANNLLIHAANTIKTETGRDVYIIVMGKGSRNAECWIPPAVNTTNGWTADEDLTAFIYAELALALAEVPGRTAIAPDAILWQQGEANNADSATVYKNKLLAVVDGLEDNAYFRPAIAWSGDFDEWNRLNRASGSYAGQMQFRGIRSATGAWSPSVNEAGDYWIIAHMSGATVNPGSVAAAAGQIVIALTASPAGAGDWLVVDADSAPVRESTRFETNVMPHTYTLFPEENQAGRNQLNYHAGDDRLSELWRTAGDYEVVTSFEADELSVVGAAEYRYSVGASGTTKFYLGPNDNGFEMASGNLTLMAGAAAQYELNGSGRLTPAADGTQDIGTGSFRVGTIHLVALGSVPTYADNTAATGGGLSAGDIYKTATGELRIVV